MIQTEIIIAITALYLALMFFIAYRADRLGSDQGHRWQPLVYTLSLAVYCTSWTFYGAVGTAANSGLTFFMIYLGPILVYVLLFPFLRRVIAIAKRQKTTSIADFLATRYGKSNVLGALVTLMAFLGTMPYIALQIKAISSSFDMLTTGGVSVGEPIWGNTAFALSIILAVFSILFGARTIDASQHHRGLIMAISFESVIKLLAFVAIAFMAYRLVDQLNVQSPDVFSTPHLLWLPFSDFEVTSSMVTILLLSAGAIFLLPRQFHVMAVEARGGEQASRWGLPVYLLIFSLAVIPITAAGLMVIGSQQNADLYVLLVPMSENQPLLSVFAFLGGFSAATGMVIVATLALSTMVSNDLIFPALVRFYRQDSSQQYHRRLLLVRRATIVAVLMLAWLYYDVGGTEKSLQSLGLLAFALAIQFLPSFVGAVYWYRGHRLGAIAGLLVGLLIWLYCLLLPSLSHLQWMPLFFKTLLLGDSLWHPQALFGISLSDPLTHGVFWSLSLNSLIYVLVSLKSQPALIDRLQAAAYLDASASAQVLESYQPFRVIDLVELCSRFTGEERTHEYFAQQGIDITRQATRQADDHFIRQTERLLASSIGTATAERLLRSISATQFEQQQLIGLIDQTGQAIEFNRELLQVTLDHIGEAVSVVDKDLRLIAWNRQYLEFFDYEPGLVRVGKPVGELIRHNIERGYGAGYQGRIEDLVERRLEMLRKVNKYSFIRDWQNGLTVQIVGARLPGGGYITTYTDITALKKAEKRLAAINETLEAKVQERTHRLSEVNSQLESVLNAKTHFLAAASHDLLQPLGASKLYLGVLEEDLDGQEEKQQLARNAHDALTAAESLLKSLLYLSKMDSGLLKPEATEFALQDIWNLLENEFAPMAAKRGLRFRLVPTRNRVVSDRSLLLSICQNLVANALRYTREGAVLVTCRARNGLLQIDVRDSGPGIAPEKQQEIFQAFTRLQTDNSEGVGLGLAICQQAADLLGHQLTLRSAPGLGSCFSLTLPAAAPQPVEVVGVGRADVLAQDFSGLQALVVDDSADNLHAISHVLSRWNLEVSQAMDNQSFYAQVGERFFDVIVMDYQLNDELNGLELLRRYAAEIDEDFLGVMATAEQDPAIRQAIVDAGFVYLPKPLQAEQLRREISTYVLPPSG